MQQAAMSGYQSFFEAKLHPSGWGCSLALVHQAKT